MTFHVCWIHLIDFNSRKKYTKFWHEFQLFHQLCYNCYFKKNSNLTWIDVLDLTPYEIDDSLSNLSLNKNYLISWRRRTLNSEATNEAIEVGPTNKQEENMYVKNTKRNFKTTSIIQAQVDKPLTMSQPHSL